MIGRRKLEDHKVNPVNDVIDIEVYLDPQDPHSNGFEYVISVPVKESVTLRFQRGPIREVGVNGITIEALLAIVVDKMRGFQSGRFACRETEIAMTKLEEAQMWLERRTRKRMAAGVEGTNYTVEGERGHRS